MLLPLLLLKFFFKKGTGLLFALKKDLFFLN